MQACFGMEMKLTVAVVEHVKPDAHLTFPYRRTVLNDEVILLSTSYGQEL